MNVHHRRAIAASERVNDVVVRVNGVLCPCHKRGRTNGVIRTDIKRDRRRIGNIGHNAMAHASSLTPNAEGCSIAGKNTAGIGPQPGTTLPGVAKMRSLIASMGFVKGVPGNGWPSASPIVKPGTERLYVCSAGFSRNPTVVPRWRTPPGPNTKAGGIPGHVNRGSFRLMATWWATNA